MSGPQLRTNFDETTVDTLFRHADRCSTPGAVAGIAINGAPVYTRGFGLANIEIPKVLSPSTRMRIASITKHFTCLAYLVLSERGLCSLDDPIATYLPEVSPAIGALTVLQLMTHCSGIRDVLDICYQFSGLDRGVSADRLLALYRTIDDANAAPGETWAYSNGGYILLSAAIERIADEPLECVFRNALFERVGMPNTLLRRWDDDFLENSATLHYPMSNGTYCRTHMGTELTGEGGIVSTVDDMLAWLAAVESSALGLLPHWSLLKTPRRLKNGACTGYGLGLFIEYHHGVEVVRHAGGVLGGTAEIIKVPSVGLDIVVMTNRGDLSATLLAEQVLQYCMPDLMPPQPRCTRPLLRGTFRSRTSGRVVELYGSANQQLAVIDAMEMPFDPDDTGVLRTSGIWKHQRTSMVPVPNWDVPNGIRFECFGSVDELTRQSPTSEPSPEFITGHYVSTATSTEADIIGSEVRELQLITRGAFGMMTYGLRFLSEGLWRAVSTDGSFMGGTLYFDGCDSGFVFNTFRTFNLRFRRIADRQ